MKDEDDPMTMVIQEKSEFLKSGKLKRVILLEKTTKMLERI